MSKSKKIFFCENEEESVDISTLFEYIEICEENTGSYSEILKKIIKYFIGSALISFIQKSKTVNNYNDLKTILLTRYDIRKFYKLEDEMPKLTDQQFDKFMKLENQLSKLSDQQFDKFMKFITAFEQLNYQIEPSLSNGRQIELFIRGVSDIEIKKAIDESNPKTLIDAINIARIKANSKFKYDNLDFYNPFFFQNNKNKKKDN